MGKSESGPKEGKVEKGLKFLRDINVLGAVALAGAAIVLPPLAATAAGVWAGVNVAQAGGYEVARRHFAKKRKK